MAGPQFSIIPVSLLRLLAELVRAGELQPAALWVVASLCVYTNRDGSAYPSIATLADESGLDEKTVRRHLHALRATRVLEVRARRKADGSQDSNGYAFTDQAWKLDGGTPQSGSTPPPEVGSTGTPIAVPPPPSHSSGSGVLPQLWEEGTPTAMGVERPSERPKERPSQRPTLAADDTLRAAVQVAAAANTGFRANPHLPPTAVEPLTSAAATQQVGDWLAEGIPLALILATVTEVARRYRPVGRQTRVASFGYFDRPVREAAEQARLTALGPATPTRQSWAAIGAAADADLQESA